MTSLYGANIPPEAVSVAKSSVGVAYRGKAGCKNWLCTMDGNPDRCYGWHCVWCDGPSNCQADCSNPDCPGEPT